MHNLTASVFCHALVASDGRTLSWREPLPSLPRHTTDMAASALSARDNTPTGSARMMVALAVAALLGLPSHPRAQVAEGPTWLATFKVWHKVTAPTADWSDALARYRAKLVEDGLSPGAADRAIRLISAYDEAELYDSVYAKSPTFSTAPSQLLVEAIRGVRPGRALDVGMGMGRNALHLGRAGWDVTGFDVSSVAFVRPRPRRALRSCVCRHTWPLMKSSSSAWRSGI